ncbi:hypothetical protein PIROE2DRAFT_1234 [Piromyces sp. E2]|nr:hypothetical protein PIROE2DRAFT_1234 [Piromyces sp. E2]|eukprot:OUM70684.1 hypothetical protein PIROE2DRAFT_1234 [Piromyces sp. E2]
MMKIIAKLNNESNLNHPIKNKNNQLVSSTEGQLNLNHPIKNKNNQLVSSTEGQLKVFHDHYQKLASDPKGQSLSKDYWKNSYIPKIL